MEDSVILVDFSHPWPNLILVIQVHTIEINGVYSHRDHYGILKNAYIQIHHILYIYYIQHLYMYKKIGDSYNQYISKNWPAIFTVGTSGHQCYGRLERCHSPASRVAGAIFSTWRWMGLLLLINKIQKVEVQTCHDKLYHSWVECKFRIGKWFFTANALQAPRDWRRTSAFGY